MAYRIDFDGVMTAEVGQLLRHIERHLNGFGIRGQTDTESSAASTASGVDCTGKNLCPQTPHNGHGPAVAAAVVVAAVVVYVVVKSSAKSTS